MKALIRPLPILAFFVVAVLLLLKLIPLAILALVLFIGGLAFSEMKRTARVREEDPNEQLDPESRALFSPVRKLTAEIEDLVEKNQSAPTIQMLGNEAITEARRMRDQVAKGLTIRKDLKKSLRGKSVASSEAESLERKATEATTETEREALLSAAAARRLELEHYRSIEDTLIRIDTALRQSEAALAEIKARLLLGATGDRSAASATGDELRETILRMKALTLTVDEAEQVLRNG